ncbi:disulfide bond formation protein B [Motiliproteus sp. SC1-56]|uniref:disulfide bond formation protein B n=1 Tax=Motiliproteus sp. SC1-56 TaxID=2799565 RepID=UPI001A8FFDE5
MSYFADLSAPSYRPLNVTGLVLCGSALLYLIGYLEGQLGLSPCTLCLATRLILVIQGLLFLLAWVHNPRQLGQRAYALLGLVIAGCGLALSGRHIWLQLLPGAGDSACFPSGAQLQALSLVENALQPVLARADACTATHGQLLGLGLPQQGLILFVLLALILIRLLRKKRQRNYFT